MKKYTVHIIWVIVAIVAFLGGRYYLPASASATATGGRGNFAGFASSTRGTFGRGGANAGGFAMGKIISEDAQSVTLQLASGSSDVVFYSPSTRISKTSFGTANDLVTGTMIVVGGTPNSDGSLTAQTIQVGGGMTFGRLQQ